MIPPCPRCGKDDFKKTRDLSAHLKRKFKCNPKTVRPKSPEQQTPPRPRSPSPAPVVHTRERDRRMEKPKAIPPTPKPELSPPPGQNQVDKYIDRHARKSGEHLRTWGARLHQRWIEVTGEERNLPLTLKDCQLLHHDLLQADDEAFELQPTMQDEIQEGDSEASSGPATQSYREEQLLI